MSASPPSARQRTHPHMRPRTRTDELFRRSSTVQSDGPSSSTTTTTAVAAAAAVAAEQAHNVAGAAADSRLSTLLLTPLMFLSYLVSLLYVARRNDARRSRLSASTSALGRDTTPAATGLGSTSARRQDDATSAWSRGGSSGGGGGGGWDKGWFVSKKHRRVVGMEMNDADAVQGVVMAVLVGGIALGAAGTAWAAWWVWRWIGRS